MIDCCIQKTEKKAVSDQTVLIEIKKTLKKKTVSDQTVLIEIKKKQSLIKLLLGFHSEKFGW